MNNYDVFISHSSKDKKLADQLCIKLESEGIKVWIAPRDLTPGEEYTSEISKGVKSSKIVLLIFSQHSFLSSAVRSEIEIGKSNKKIIINYPIEEIELDDSWTYLLSLIHWLEVRNEESDDKLISLIKKHIQNTEFSAESLVKNADMLVKEYDKASQQNHDLFLKSNKDKFQPLFYVERTKFQQFFLDNKDQRILFLLGEAGMGKTNELCYLVNNSHKFEDSWFIAYNSQELVKKVDSILIQQFKGFYYSDQQIVLEKLLDKIHEFAKKSNKKIYFLFDAINEASSYPTSNSALKNTPHIQLFRDLRESILKEKYENFRVIISYRTTLFEYLKDVISRELGTSLLDIPKFSLEKFTNEELVKAYENSHGFFNLHTSIEKFKSNSFSKIRTSISSPLLFRLIVESYKDDFLPEHLEQYNFANIVKKRLYSDLYKCSFAAYEALFRLTYYMRKNHFDQVEMAKIFDPSCEELKEIRNDLLVDNEISDAYNILFNDNYLKLDQTGVIRFTYEKIQEAVFEISFLNEYEDKFKGKVIPCDVYVDIVLSQELDYDIITYSYLCNAIVNNYVNSKSKSRLKTIEDLSRITEPRIQPLILIVISKLEHLSYKSIRNDIVMNMLKTNEVPLLDTSLKLINVFCTKYESKEDYKKDIDQDNSPIEYFKYIFNNNSDDSILNKAGVQFYNTLLQNKHLSAMMLEELFTGLLKGNKININYLMQLGLLSFLVSIDVLVSKDQASEEKKKFVFDYILNYWKQILNKIFSTNSRFYHPNFPIASSVISYIPFWLRNLILRNAIKIASTKYFNVQSDYVNNLTEYNHFFKNIPLNSDKHWSKTDFANISELFDAKIQLTDDKIRLITEAFKSGDAFSFMMIERMLINRGLNYWEDVKKACSTALNLKDEDTPYTDYIKMSQCYVLFHIIDKSPSDQWRSDAEQEAYEMLENTVYEWSKRTYGRFNSPYISNVKTQYGVYKQFVLNWYIVASCKKNKYDAFSVDHVPMITRLIDETILSRNNEIRDLDLIFYIVENISVAATNLGKINSALAVFDYLLCKLNNEELVNKLNSKKKIQEYEDCHIEEYMISVLNTMKSFFTKEVAAYEANHLCVHVENGNMLASLIYTKSKVISNTQETLGSLLTSRFGNFFVWGLSDDDFRAFIVRELQKSIRAKSNKQWAFWEIKQAFDTLLDHKL